MGTAAAFFDLDRTLLRGASGPILTEALQRAGVVPTRSLPGQGLLYKAFDTFGESLTGMALARAAAAALRGRSRAKVLAAAAAATDDLMDLVAPYAVAALEEHHDAGRPVVLATTTPRDLVEPLARRLGLDDMVATRYQVATADDGDERYTGGLDGAFVWAAGKLTAVRWWAAQHGIEMADSWAYSDSVYDVPLLSSVGHPVAVNADPRLAVVATLRRWPQRHFDAPAGVPKLVGFEPFDLVKAVVRPESIPYARFDIAGTDNIPARGPAIVVANHRSYFDAVALGLTVTGAGRLPRALAKKEIFDAPVLGLIARVLGQIEVDRHDAGAAGAAGPAGREALASAVRAINGGEVVVILPQGTIPRGEAFFSPKLEGRTGAARLATATGAPVIPVGMWGTEKVWPRSSRVPNVTNVLHPPLIRIRVGPPVRGLTGDAAADTARIMDAIAAQLPPEARQAHQPSAEELRQAKPPS
ncbi:MAG TPA: HAD-IB family hydrolase [Acidimicrobiales bacterium]|jgi:putative phosphoserine phosphatase/1-acylglycerol-3-phosphate O-acyltransferase|nr:HAD-IB family hydrolase [Acidimicrobiales bacterium]